MTLRRRHLAKFRPSLGQIFDPVVHNYKARLVIMVLPFNMFYELPPKLFTLLKEGF